MVRTPVAIMNDFRLFCCSSQPMEIINHAVIRQMEPLKRGSGTQFPPIRAPPCMTVLLHALLGAVLCKETTQLPPPNEWLLWKAK